MFWTFRGNDLLLTIRLTPNAGVDRIDRPLVLADGKTVLAARVSAIPEGGEANDALCKLVTKTVGLPKSRVSVVSGQTSRVKTVRIEGGGPALVDALVGATAGSGFEKNRVQ